MKKLLRTLVINASAENTKILVQELQHLHYQVQFKFVNTVERLRSTLTADGWNMILGEYGSSEFPISQAVEALMQHHELPFLIYSGPLNPSTMIAALQPGSNEFVVRGQFTDFAEILNAELDTVTRRRQPVKTPLPSQASQKDLPDNTFHLSPVGICRTTLDGRLQDASQSLAEMLGFSQEELEGKHFNEITHPDDREAGIDMVTKMIAGETPNVSFEKRYLHKNGNAVSALVSSSLLRDTSGGPLYFVTHILNMDDWKRAEAIRLQSEARYRTLYDDSPISYWEEDLSEVKQYFERLYESGITDLETYFGEHPEAIPECLSLIRIVDVNQITLLLYEAQSHQELVAGIGRIFREETLPILRDQLIALANGATKFGSEMITYTLTGTKLDVERIVSLAPGSEESWSKVLVIINDITERKQAEQQQRQSEENFAKAFSSSPTALMITRRADGKYLALNKAYCTIIGYEESELLGHLTTEFNIYTNPNQRREIVTQLMSQGWLRNYEATIQNKSGELRIVLASLELIQFNNEDCILTTLVDITDRKQAEDRFRLVVESAPNAILLVNREGLIEMVNSQAERFFGYERNELLGSSVDRLVPTRFRNIHLNHRQEYFEDLQARPMGAGRDLHGIRKDGSEFPVEIGLTPITVGDSLLVIATIVDITERKQAEDALLRRTEDLRRSNAELEQFAYVSSHDLQEPLRMVSSYVQLLAKRYKGRLDEDADVFIGFAVEGATRMQQLINDLLTYSRVGTQAKPFAAISMEKILDHVLANLQIALQECQAVVTHDPLPTLMADNVQMVQLFQNLIGNAIKFREASPPHVHISAERQDKGWLFAVQDNGVGIDPQFAQRIFIIFQRLHTRAEYPGTGIGLAICKKIVERHGGHIWVEPAPVHGSIFRFTISD